MARSFHEFESDIWPQWNFISIGDFHTGEFGLSTFGHHNFSAGFISQLDVACEKIGVKMGEDHIFNRKAFGFGIGEILVNVALGIDDGGDFRGLVSNHIRGV